MSNINFGIDLGTSNSLIAKFEAGSVVVFKNPSGFRETLPSVVGYRNGRVLVGGQAMAHLSKDPKSFASRFKRKMGTNDTYKIESTQREVSPEELSAHVLRELKTFIHTGEDPKSVVITIPASFDTAQSNATKTAAKMAGFETVFLLQEPIAASLAYANKDKDVQLNNGQWLVYDLGGGTFDAALVRILDGELSVVDHEGDNYLGGGDLDEQIVEQIVVPEIERRGLFTDLLREMKSASGKHNKLWHLLLPGAEAAKVELSSRESTDIELDLIDGLRDDRGRQVDGLVEIRRAHIEALAKKPVQKTVELMKRILLRNGLESKDIQFVLMVGGATLMPFVRKSVEMAMGIPVNTSIDPTNAICVGAAYYAATKKVGDAKAPEEQQELKLEIKTSYNTSSQELSEIFSAKFIGNINGITYRITSADGSFDSGSRRVAERISEELPLRANSFNTFKIKLLDELGGTVNVGFSEIQITQGKYSIAGQMLPEDLCLVRDDLATGDTKLDALFKRNAALPATARRTVEASKLLDKGHGDLIQIMVVEGEQARHSSTNKLIGILSISGRELDRSLPKGAYVELEFKISESRDISVSAEIVSTGQRFSDIFKPKQRSVSPRGLVRGMGELSIKIKEEQKIALSSGDARTSSALGALDAEAASVGSRANMLGEDDVTDEKFQLEDQARELMQKVLMLTATKKSNLAKLAYKQERESLEDVISEANFEERKKYNEARGMEEVVLRSTDAKFIEAATDTLWQIRCSIQSRSLSFQTAVFRWLQGKSHEMRDSSEVGKLLFAGEAFLRDHAVDALRTVNNQLARKLPANTADAREHLVGIV